MTTPTPPQHPEPLSEDEELAQWHDLQNAQIDSMMHVWDNPEDEVWNDLEIPGWEPNAPGRTHEPP